jgi:hypothetical protein
MDGPIIIIMMVRLRPLSRLGTQRGPGSPSVTVQASESDSEFNGLSLQARGSVQVTRLSPRLEVTSQDGGGHVTGRRRSRHRTAEVTSQDGGGHVTGRHYRDSSSP